MTEPRTLDRNLDWEGCLNARDLGGLPTAGGGATRWRSIVRSDNPAYLTLAGWAALRAYGIRTIVGLRTAGAPFTEPDGALVPPDVEIVRVAVEDLGDADFRKRCVDTGHWCTPIYFRDAITRWPERCAAALAAVAGARPGGVVVSCARGCDRTGLVSLLLLALAGVAPDDIVADWQLSVERLRPRETTHERELQETLARESTSVRATITGTLESVDIEAQLRRGGLTDADLAALRARLAGPIRGDS